jgi:hypothetical protein
MPSIGQSGQQGFVEVQAGRGGGDRARVAGIHRLVAGFVGVAGGAFDIGWQRQATVALKQGDQIVGVGKAQVKELAGAAEHLHVERSLQMEPAARLRRLTGTDLGQGLVAAQGTFDHHLHLTAGVLGAEQAGMQHPGVVEDQQIPGERREGRSAKCRSARLGCTRSRRLSVRRSSGAWAISSSGSR